MKAAGCTSSVTAAGEQPARAYALAIDAPLAGEWEYAHRVVQEMDDPLACWIPAILYRIKGDVWNGRYCYGRTDRWRYEEQRDAHAELLLVLAGRD
ncbi:MAG: hypothetical protein JNK99_17120 [Candidatus Accumulibacter sp.]|uniref:hypothetical protein n=1 Tax=Accumulibacter sp. TaxID=2053492 RepID=UPI001A4D59DF|nr:hypothetical protein [Accumulibacter sp.]MBL8396438.1 hypothetical protein [Accumulibacter sp.]